MDTSVGLRPAASGYKPGTHTASGTAGRDALMATGLLLTTATQLRMPGLPLGPGEICLALWIVLVTVLEFGRYTRLTPALRRLLLFWALFAVAQSLGTLTALAIGDTHDPALFWHDVLAYPLAGAFSCLSVVEPGAPRRLRRGAEIFAGLGAACLIPQLAVGWGVIALPLIDPWLGDRFQGWSNNPNQLAFLCALLVLVSLHLADTAGRPGKRVAALLPMVPAILVGRLTKTDTFTFALLAALPLYGLVKLRFRLGASEPALSLRTSLAWIAVIAIPAMLASTAPLALWAAGDADRMAMDLMKNGGKEASTEFEIRLALWREAVGRGVDSYFLGLGPGPHLPIPREIRTVRVTDPVPEGRDHPAINGTPDFEAHNSPLDLFTQGGLLAAGSFLWVFASAGLASYRARRAGLVALLIAVGIFAFTNNIVRPPTFWFAIALCLVARDRTEDALVAG